MNEHTILFSPPMVQANLDGCKRMTRRMTGLDNVNEDPDAIEFVRFQKYEKDGSYRAIFKHEDADGFGSVKCPYGQPGDLLWVREMFFAYGLWSSILDTDTGKKKWSFQDLTISEGFQYKYVSLPPEKVYQNRGHIGWYKRPSMFMPKSAARIWLQVEEIRVERLQNISEEDAMSEGVQCIRRTSGYCWMNYIIGEYVYPSTAKYSFVTLWKKINGNDWNIGWDANPWVWVVKYKVLSTTGKPSF